MSTFLFTPEGGEPITVKARSMKQALTKILGEDWHAWNTMGYMMVHRFSDGKLLGTVEVVA